jgi:RHS repeat-associated protein
VTPQHLHQRRKGTGWWVSYIHLSGNLLAEYFAGTTYFVHQDHVGSTRLLTDVNGCVVDNLDYLPFGELYSYSASCSAADNTHKFTSDERDSESNLDNSQARYYSSQQGRFMSPDPANIAATDPANPQSWNQYAYVLNNPVTMTDPSGLCGATDFSGGDGEGDFGFCVAWGDFGTGPQVDDRNDRWGPQSPLYIPPNVGQSPNPFDGETNGIPNGLQIPTLGCCQCREENQTKSCLLGYSASFGEVSSRAARGP